MVTWIKNKLSFLRQLFVTEKKLFTIVIIIFIAMVSVETSITANKFASVIGKEAELLERNIAYVSQVYTVDLHNLKHKIEKTYHGKVTNQDSKLKSLINTIPEGVGEILILNKDFIIVSALHSKKYNKINHDLSYRKYILRLKNNPNEMQINEPVIGILTKTWAIPMAIGITDNNNKFSGAIIFSITLSTFSKVLKDKRYLADLKDVIFTKDVLTSQKTFHLYELIAEPIYFFVNYVIVNSSEHLYISCDSKAVVDKLTMVFNVEKLKAQYLRSILIYIMLICLGACLYLFIVNKFNKEIMQPLKGIADSMAKVVESQTLSNNGALTSNPSNSIGYLSSVANKLTDHLYEVKETNNRLNEKIVISHSFFSSLLNSLYQNQKFTTELIEDVFASNTGKNLHYLNLDNLIQDMDNFSAEIIDLAGKCSHYLKIGKVEIDILSTFKEIFVINEVVYVGSKEKNCLELYKEPFIELLQNIQSLIPVSDRHLITLCIEKQFKEGNLLFALKITLPISNGLEVSYKDRLQISILSLLNRAIVKYENAQSSSIVIYICT